MALLDSFIGGGGDSPSPGLLYDFIDPTTGKIDPQAYQQARSRDSMLSAAAGLLSASGPSRLPIGLGQALGMGVQGYLKGQEGFDQTALKGMLANSQLTTAGLQQDVLRDQATGRRLLQASLGGANPSRSTLPLASPGGAGAPVGYLGSMPGVGAPAGIGGAGSVGLLSGASPSVGGFNVGSGGGGAAAPTLNATPDASGTYQVGGASGAPQAPPGLLYSGASTQPAAAAAASRLIDPTSALRTAMTYSAYGLPGGDTYLKFAESPTGFYRDQRGNLQVEPGGPADPSYLGRKSYAEGYGTSQGQLPADITKMGAQADQDIRKAGPIAWAQAAPQLWKDLRSQEGAARFDTVTIRNPDGTTTIKPKLSAFGGTPAGGLPDGGAGSVGGFNVGGGAGGGISGPLQLTPEQEAYSKGLGEYGTSLRDASDSAKELNTRLDQMDVALQGFNPGAGADNTAAMKRVVDGVATSLGYDGAFKDSLPSYQEFSKLATQYAAEQARKLGAREAASVVQMMVNSNPNAALTPDAIKSMMGGLRAMNDYAIAKNTAAAQYRQQNNGSLGGFDTSGWMQQNPPTRFLIPYMTNDQLMKLRAAAANRGQ